MSTSAEKTSSAIRMDKVYAAYARENYASILNAVAPSKMEDVIQGLEAHFAELLKKDPDACGQCDVCLAWSDISLDACPFCNDGKVPPKAVAAPAPSVPTPSSAIVDISPKRQRKSEASAPKLGLLVGGRATLTEKDLDAEVEGIIRDSRTANEGAYAVGQRIIRIHDELWMLRRDADGKQKYKSFAQFVEEELACSITYANKLRRVAECFSKEQFFQYGIEALKAITSAPKEVHEDLLRRRSEGATVQELEVEVRQIRDDKGIKVIETDALQSATQTREHSSLTAATTAAAAVKRSKKEGAAITIGLKTDKPIDVPLFARPKSTKKKEEPRRAREIEDQPFGEVEALNGVKLFFVLKKTPAGELFIKFSPRREDEE